MTYIKNINIQKQVFPKITLRKSLLFIDLDFMSTKFQTNPYLVGTFNILVDKNSRLQVACNS